MSHASYAPTRDEVATPAPWQLAKDLFRATPIYLFLQALNRR